MNVYGAEKMSVYLGRYLAEGSGEDTVIGGDKSAAEINPDAGTGASGIPDRRGSSAELDRWWEQIGAAYDSEKEAQQKEFEKLGYLTRYH